MADEEIRQPENWNEVMDLAAARRACEAVHEPGEGIAHDAPNGDKTDESLPAIEGYTIDRRLGGGGGGEVYLAIRTGSARPLALKLLRQSLGESPESKRAWRELDVLEQLRLPAIPRLLDHGVHDGRMFLVTEFICGNSLVDHCETNSLDRRTRVELLAKVADAVQSLHEYGVIHRDIKPSNIIVEDRGASENGSAPARPRPMLIDLGIATLLTGDVAETLTVEGTPVGSPAFMAPEQARGDKTAISTRSDVYSLGATAYVMLTGGTPHDMDATLHEAIRRVAQDEPRGPRELDATLPKPLAAILAKAAARRPDDRYYSAADFTADLRRWLRREPVEAGRQSVAQRMGRFVARHPVIAVATCSLGILVAIAAIYSATAWRAQHDQDFIKLLASDAERDDLLGYSVCVGDSFAILGASREDSTGQNTGSAYIFERDVDGGWTEAAKLIGAGSVSGDAFGTSVAIFGEIAVVGAIFDSERGEEHCGSAYVFRYDGIGWAQEAKLLAHDGATGDHCGNAVAVWGQRIVIGAPYDGDNGEHSGSAYVYRYENAHWVQEAKLLPGDGEEKDVFGVSVAIDGDTIICSAYDDDNAKGLAAGSVYVFQRTDDIWTQSAKLFASDGAPADTFGVSVDISGDSIIVGAMNDDDNGADSGSAYIYRYLDGTWVEEAKLLPENGEETDYFGRSVSIFADTVLVGTFPQYGDGGTAGAGYVFRFDGVKWDQEARLVSDDRIPGDHFGHSVSIYGDTIMIGAPEDDDGGPAAGAAYIFTRGWQSRLPG